MSTPTTTCDVCGKPATIAPARYRGVSRPPLPPPPDVKGPPPTDVLGVMMEWYEVTCVTGLHRKLIPASEYANLSLTSYAKE